MEIFYIGDFCQKYKYFGTVETKEELYDMLNKNRFIGPFDIVYCMEDETYYSLDVDFSAYQLSVGNQHYTVSTFFHFLNIDDTVAIDGKNYKVLNISFELKTENAYYTLLDMDTNEQVKSLVSIVDSTCIKNLYPMQSLEFENTVKQYS